MGPVLVTGACGLVGRATVSRLHEQGKTVVATDLDTPANRKVAKKLPAAVPVLWIDLTDESDVRSMVDRVAPSVIVHLAAVNRNFSRCLDPQTHLVTADFHHGDHDVLVDHDALVPLAGQNQHLAGLS